jgi:hypothetical protein
MCEVELLRKEEVAPLGTPAARRRWCPGLAFVVDWWQPPGAED